ncbi:DUF4907 domain-containing protein [Lacihabitans sp. CCS-44]|uniref:DUF4907 domain-containing protein n=1 Tax=Lacihabitans sp. CCS-44 TaxID=2487331 RepID=UPI0020CF8360|nr:DUF4907 domain-containing protein [Lacihabitans sp. CCS-44]MCP9755532.1 DUF4907 domain-containing protein [Lacihabitans sp. CCS-44]
MLKFCLIIILEVTAFCFQISVYNYEIFQKTDKSYGYKIRKESKVLIYQEIVPGRDGNMGFKSKVDCIKIAQLVLLKMESGRFPPIVTKEDLKKLNIK